MTQNLNDDALIFIERTDFEELITLAQTDESVGILRLGLLIGLSMIPLFLLVVYLLAFLSGWTLHLVCEEINAVTTYCGMMLSKNP